MGVDGRFPCMCRRKQQCYNVDHKNMRKYEYQHGNIHLQAAEQVKEMIRNEQDLYNLGIIMA